MRTPAKTTWIAVADGGKALLLENIGTPAAPELRVLAAREPENPPTREQGTDRPGRFPDPGPGQRSAVEETDWHRFAEERFAQEFATVLNRAAEQGDCDEIVLVAPDRVLGALRGALSPKASDMVAGELHKDLTNHPVPEITGHVRLLLRPGI